MNKTVEQTIRDYIENSFLAEDQMVALGNDDDLLIVLDSLQILRMLMDLETEYSIRVDPSEFTPENLGSVQRLADFVGRKLRSAAC
ncbi:MAG TPA: acyl carrier protein [Pirellulaceae bacterium]|jgi:acyl carrier protein